jgi:hypothetical protein
VGLSQKVLGCLPCQLIGHRGTRSSKTQHNQNRKAATNHKRAAGSD